MAGWETCRGSRLGACREGSQGHMGRRVRACREGQLEAHGEVGWGHIEKINQMK